MAKKLKKDFPIFANNKKLIYLDSAATSQRPKQVIKSLVDFYEKENANASRGVYTLAEKATARYESARRTVAKFIRAEPEEIIFTRNATESINLVSRSISPLIQKGKKEILLTEMEHHSNIIPWQQLAKKHKLKLNFVKLTPDFTLDLNDLKEKLTNKTAIFAFTHISNVLGTVNDISLLTKVAKSVGAITIIDAAQSIHCKKIDVRKIGCDFLVFSSHKMLGPTGIGVLYGKEKLLEKMPPFNFGGGMIKTVSFGDSKFADIPQRFEAGTPNIAEATALAEAIDYIGNIGLENISEWEESLADYTEKKLREIQGVDVYRTKSGESSGIVSFTLDSIHPHDVASLLNEHYIAIRAGHHCAMPLMKRLGVLGTCRASFYFYNTKEDADALILAIKKVKKRFE
ncbi:MAG: SufS family cysteine desulfurase [Nanoarchaeota archaeon]|nr:SufS family cysteine desulfurase [Nanoarchaeota archaeon]